MAWWLQIMSSALLVQHVQAEWLCPSSAVEESRSMEICASLGHPVIQNDTLNY